MTDLGDRYDLEEVRQIKPDTVEKFHAAIGDAGPLLKALRDRGITDDMIQHARLGFHKGRITIPVRDDKFRFVNVRRYLPGAPGDKKMQNTPGYGKPAIYQIQDLQYDKIWLCGGELKALAAGWYLRDQDVGAVAVTAGEGAWVDDWTAKFKGKTVYICMDIDLGGRKAAESLAARLCRVADVYVIDLPLDPEQYPKGDVNDYIGQEGARGDELVAAMEAADLFVPGEVEEVEEDAVQIHVSQALSKHNIGKKVKFDAIVTMKSQDPFLVPKKVVFDCNKDTKNCAQCPLFMLGEDDDTAATVEIRPTAQGILEMVDAPASRQGDAIKKALKVPPCRVVSFAPLQYFSVREIRLSPKLSISEESGSDVLLPGFCIDTDIDLNAPHEFEAVLWPHPKDQKATLLISCAEQSIDSLATFVPDNLDQLTTFQPKEWTLEALEAKLDDIYGDLEANVTTIRKRRDMHLVLDLTYHSVLFFNFDGRVRNGWVNSLILGDSSQGKSEASTQLKDHYGLGTRVECKNASVAGLIGGLQQLGTRWFVSWGVIPTHDRRLVILEEVKGTPVETIGRLTDMRSSGVAEIPKIEHRKASARTRLVFISNPRSSRQMSSYPFGVAAVEELIGGLEDVRRFDVAYIVSSEEVSSEDINRMSTDYDRVSHTYTGEMCRQLILWGWTLKPDQIKFTDEAIQAVMRIANEACKKYSEGIPLIDRGTTRLKVARLAAALAVRTFSAEQGILVVRECHVKSVWKLLDRIYSNPIFGYADFSQARTKTEVMGSVEELTTFIEARTYPADFVRNLILQDEITHIDFQDWCDVDRDGAQEVMSFLVRKRALYRKRQSYRKTPPFIQLLKKLDGTLTEEQDDINKYEA